MKSITIKVGEPHEVILEDFSHYMEQVTCALVFFLQSPSAQVVHNRHCVLRERTPPKLYIICDKYQHLHLAPTFEQHMEPPPKTSNAKLTKSPTCLEYEVFKRYFGPHGGGHYPTLVDTFHPHRLYYHLMGLKSH
jgi:hypothetical protein